MKASERKAAARLSRAQRELRRAEMSARALANLSEARRAKMAALFESIKRDLDIIHTPAQIAAAAAVVAVDPQSPQACLVLESRA